MRVFSHVVGVIPWFESTHWEINMSYFSDFMCIPRFQRIRTEANKEITVPLLNNWHERVFSFVQQIKKFPYHFIISCPFRLVISIKLFKFILQFYSLDELIGLQTCIHLYSPNKVAAAKHVEWRLPLFSSCQRVNIL